MNRHTPVRTTDSMIDRLREAAGRVLREARSHHGLIALAAFGFLAPQGHAGAGFGLLFLFMAALAHWRRFIHDITRDRFFLVWCVLAVYLVFRAVDAALEFPATSHEQWDWAFRLARTGFFVVLVSWWLDADTRRVMLLAGAALVGYCLEVLVELDPERIDAIVSGGQRNMLGVALPVGLAGAIAAIGLIVFLPRLLRHAARQNRLMKTFVYSAITASAVILALVQVITQSRAVVGMLIVLLPTIVAWQLFARWNTAQERGSLGAAYAVAVGLFAVAVVLVGPKLADKLGREYADTVPYVVSGELQDMPKSSAGWRIHLNVHGANLAALRPWTGWGPGTSSTRDLADRYGMVDLTSRSHLHNTYLEILVRLGSIGVLLYLIAVGLLLRNAIRSRPATGCMPGDVGVFLIGGCALMAGWSLIDFHLVNWNFIVPLVLLAALAHTYGADWRGSRTDRG